MVVFFVIFVVVSVLFVLEFMRGRESEGVDQEIDEEIDCQSAEDWAMKHKKVK